MDTAILLILALSSNLQHHKETVITKCFLVDALFGSMFPGNGFEAFLLQFCTKSRIENEMEKFFNHINGCKIGSTGTAAKQKVQ